MNRIGFIDYESRPQIQNKKSTPKEEVDNVNHPAHYNWIPGFEVADITDYFNFNLGNSLKYILRAGKKSDNILEDLKKARWYLDREISLLRSRQNFPLN